MDEEDLIARNKRSLHALRAQSPSEVDFISAVAHSMALSQLEIRDQRQALTEIAKDNRHHRGFAAAVERHGLQRVEALVRTAVDDLCAAKRSLDERTVSVFTHLTAAGLTSEKAGEIVKKLEGHESYMMERWRSALKKLGLVLDGASAEQDWSWAARIGRSENSCDT